MKQSDQKGNNNQEEEKLNLVSDNVLAGEDDDQHMLAVNSQMIMESYQSTKSLTLQDPYKDLVNLRQSRFGNHANEFLHYLHKRGLALHVRNSIRNVVHSQLALGFMEFFIRQEVYLNESQNNKLHFLSAMSYSKDLQHFQPKLWFPIPPPSEELHINSSPFTNANQLVRLSLIFQFVSDADRDAFVDQFIGITMKDVDYINLDPDDVTQFRGSIVSIIHKTLEFIYLKLDFKSYLPKPKVRISNNRQRLVNLISVDCCQEASRIIINSISSYIQNYYCNYFNNIAETSNTFVAFSFRTGQELQIESISDKYCLISSWDHCIAEHAKILINECQTNGPHGAISKVNSQRFQEFAYLSYPTVIQEIADFEMLEKQILENENLHNTINYDVRKLAKIINNPNQQQLKLPSGQQDVQLQFPTSFNAQQNQQPITNPFQSPTQKNQMLGTSIQDLMISNQNQINPKSNTLIPKSAMNYSLQMQQNQQALQSQIQLQPNFIGFSSITSPQSKNIPMKPVILNNAQVIDVSDTSPIQSQIQNKSAAIENEKPKNDHKKKFKPPYQDRGSLKNDLSKLADNKNPIKNPRVQNPPKDSPPANDKDSNAQQSKTKSNKKRNKRKKNDSPDPAQLISDDEEKIRNEAKEDQEMDEAQK